MTRSQLHDKLPIVEGIRRCQQIRNVFQNDAISMARKVGGSWVTVPG